MSKVHLVIGQNNSGKSNVLRFAEQFLAAIGGFRQFEAPQGLDVPRGPNVSTEFRLAIALRVSEDIWQRLTDAVAHAQYRPLVRPAFEKLLSHARIARAGDGIAWIPCSYTPTAPAGARFVVSAEIAEQVLSEVELPDMEATAVRLVRQEFDRTGREAPFERVLEWFVNQALSDAPLPPVATIQALRSIHEGSNLDDQDFSGRGLVKRLARLESPAIDRLDDRIKFDQINEFVATVLEEPDARITIPAEQDVIHVISKGVELPLQNLGTGLHEVIILAAAATVLDDHLVCIEEPEVHLHPVLQRRLLAYLAKNTTNQYLIATHSAQMLDSNLASVSHVTLDDVRSSVRPATDVGELAHISADLGYRPSDLMQSNAVIWVEGPSDRTYVAAWLKLVAPELIEGVHYSLMFYGGRLLSHLTTSQNEVTEFIQLRRLNQHLAILIDSDRRRSGQRLNDTKLRIRREFESDRVTGFAWITWGYAIENYVPYELLDAAATVVTPSRPMRWRGERYDNPLPNPANRTNFDKVAIARQVADAWAPETSMPGDLRHQIDRLVDFIRAAND